MTDAASDIDLIEARLRAVTVYRPGPAEMDEIAALVETATQPFEIGDVTGDDPAVQYVPLVDASPA